MDAPGELAVLVCITAPESADVIPEPEYSNFCFQAGDKFCLLEERTLIFEQNNNCGKIVFFNLKKTFSFFPSAVRIDCPVSSLPLKYRLQNLLQFTTFQKTRNPRVFRKFLFPNAVAY